LSSAYLLLFSARSFWIKPREGEEGGLEPVADLKLCSLRKSDKETFVGDDEYSMVMAG